MTSATSIAKTLRFAANCVPLGGALYRRLENRKSLIRNGLRGDLIAKPCIRNRVART